MYDHDKLLRELERDEGLRLKPYQDSLGIWTVGVGHNLEAHGLPLHMIIGLLEKHGLPHEYSDELLEGHIEDALLGLTRLWVGWKEELSDVRQRVLINMYFNLGESRFGRFPKFWAALKEGNYEEAALQMMESKWAKQVGVRADRLRDMMLSG